MMTTVYCCICFFIVACQSRKMLDAEGYSNDYAYEAEPEPENIRVSNGTPLTLKCHHGLSTWYYKKCNSNFYELICDKKNLNWSRLSITKGRIHIAAASKNHSGKYKCFENGVLKKVFAVDVFDLDYDGTRPEVAPLKTSNLTGQINMEFTIQCNVTSEVPPAIIWFKSCYGQKCDLEYNQVCYCHINTSITNYNIGHTYLSKYLIFNARDVDTGIYACLAVSEYGKDVQNVTIIVPSNKEENESFSLLFLIPLTLILAPIAVWLCYFRRKKKTVTKIVEQQRQLIRPTVRINEEMNEII